MGVTTSETPRVLVAFDASPGADRALRVLRESPWQAGTRVRVLAVLPKLWEIDLSSQQVAETEKQRVRDLVHEAVDGLQDLEIEIAVVEGRPASTIVDEAARWKADLIIMGNRGRGTIATVLLGSVAAEVVDHAPCPVLVVRTALGGTTVFADDGSDGAALAGGMLRRFPALAGRSTRVVSVVHVQRPLSSGIAPSMRAAVAADQEEMLIAARTASLRVAEDAVAGLTKAGLTATAAVHEGDPAQEILRDVEETKASLIVMGSHGRSGLTRVLLGSVARNVLMHAHASVLIARGKTH